MHFMRVMTTALRYFKPEMPSRRMAKTGILSSGYFAQPLDMLMPLVVFILTDFTAFATFKRLQLWYSTNKLLSLCLGVRNNSALM